MIGVCFLSLLAIPMTYITNTAQTLHGELGLFVTGAVCLVSVCCLAKLAFSSAAKRYGEDGNTDWLLYVFTLGSFASVVDLIIGLETDGYISGFMSVYLRDGEPYLGTPYGALISYWDGTAHYAMYMFMMIAMAKKRNYRAVGLYWAGSIGHSMLVLVPGAILGKYGVRWSFLLNVPYIFIPFISAARFLNEGKKDRQKKDPNLHASRPSRDGVRTLWSRPFDLSLILFLLASIAFCLLRGFAVLGCKNEIATSYLHFYEPYLKDPVVFPKIQMLIYLFYFIPYFIATIVALLYSGHSWLPDWALLFAGAAAQAQIPHILGSMHHRTPVNFRLPGHGSAWVVFWLGNLLLLIVPHLVAVRCWLFPRRFLLPNANPEVDGQPASLVSGESVKRD